MLMLQIAVEWQTLMGMIQNMLMSGLQYSVFFQSVSFTHDLSALSVTAAPVCTFTLRLISTFVERSHFFLLMLQHEAVCWNLLFNSDLLHIYIIASGLLNFPLCLCRILPMVSRNLKAQPPLRQALCLVSTCIYFCFLFNTTHIWLQIVHGFCCAECWCFIVL